MARLRSGADLSQQCLGERRHQRHARPGRRPARPRRDRIAAGRAPYRRQQFQQSHRPSQPYPADRRRAQRQSAGHRPICESRPVLGEEVNFGGQLVGRGYDPGALTGDMGVGAAFELRYDLTPSWFYADAAQIFSFVDGGEIWNHNGATPTSNQIASAGAGLRLTMPENVQLNAFYGKALVAVPGNDENKRSSRVMVYTSIRF